MQYRNLKKEELKDLRKLQSIVYFMKYEEDKTGITPEIDKTRWELARGAFTEEGKLAAVLEMIPFKSYLDGTVVGSPGIAGVATLLEHRRGGAVKNLLKKAYVEMYEKGDVMSYLYPFSHEYYRKYGYAQGSYGDMITVDIKQMYDIETDGYTKQYFPGDGYDDLKTVYNHFAAQYNCCVAREDWRWNTLFLKDPYKNDDRVFIRFNENNEPIAYMKIKPEKVENYTYDMNVIETAWVGYEGIRGLMAIINGYKGDLRKIKLIVPAGFPIEILVKETWGTEVSRYHTGMNRIINAQKAFEIIKKPDSPGSVVIGVDDKHAPWNSGNWLVEWKMAECSVAKTKKSPDLQCDVSSLSQLITGHMKFNEMMVKPDVVLHDKWDIMEKLFIKKNCFIWDRF